MASLTHSRAIWQVQALPALEAGDHVAADVLFGPGALYGALRFGAPGGLKGLPATLSGLKGFINTYRDIPTVFRPTGSTSPVDRGDLPRVVSHYFDR